MKKIAAILFVLSNVTIYAQQPSLETGKIFSARQTPVHDPVMIKQGDTYYLFCTGFGIAVWSSKDLKTWRKEAPVFAKAPQWAVDTIPRFRGHIWAPDISYHN